MWLETAKMAPELTGNLLGGALLGDVLARMAAAQEATSGGSQVRRRRRATGACTSGARHIPPTAAC